MNPCDRSFVLSGPSVRLCKSVTKSKRLRRGAQPLWAQLRSWGTRQDLRGAEQSQAACHSWIHPHWQQQKNLCKPRTKPAIPAECVLPVNVQTYKHLHQLHTIESQTFDLFLFVLAAFSSLFTRREIYFCSGSRALNQTRGAASWWLLCGCLLEVLLLWSMLVFFLVANVHQNPACCTFLIWLGMRGSNWRRIPNWAFFPSKSKFLCLNAPLFRLPSFSQSLRSLCPVITLQVPVHFLSAALPSGRVSHLVRAAAQHRHCLLLLQLCVCWRSYTVALVLWSLWAGTHSHSAPWPVL